MSASLHFPILPAGTVLTGSGQTAKMPVATLSQLAVVVKISAVSGTFAGGQGFSCKLVGSCDGGTTWADVPYDKQLVTANTQPDATAVASKKSIVDVAQATGTWVAIYNVMPFDVVALAYYVSGTATPTFTLGADASGK